MNRIERLLRAVDRFQQRHTVLGFPFAVIKKYGDDRAGRQAALLSHYAFLSLFPLLLVFVTVLGYVLAGNPELQEELIDALVAQFPVLGSQIQDSVRTIQGSGVALVIGFLLTLWGGLGVTQSAQEAMNTVWNVPHKDRPNFWLRLVRSLLALLVVVAEVVVATALAHRGVTGAGTFGRIALLGGSLLLNFVLLLVLFQILTATWLPWRCLLPGAAVGAVAWSVLQSVGVTILSRQLEQANLLYGVFAVVIVLLGWLYLGSQLLLYSAETNVVLARRLWPRSMFQPPLTEPDRRVLTALAQSEERRPEQRVEVTFLDPAAAGADPSSAAKPDDRGQP